MPNWLSCSHPAGVIPRQMTGEHGGFVEQVGVEVLVAEARLGRMQRGVGEVDAARVR